MAKMEFKYGTSGRPAVASAEPSAALEINGVKLEFRAPYLKEKGIDTLTFELTKAEARMFAVAITEATKAP